MEFKCIHCGHRFTSRKTKVRKRKCGRCGSTAVVQVVPVSSPSPSSNPQYQPRPAGIPIPTRPRKMGKPSPNLPPNLAKWTPDQFTLPNLYALEAFLGGEEVLNMWDMLEDIRGVKNPDELKKIMEEDSELHTRKLKTLAFSALVDKIERRQSRNDLQQLKWEIKRLEEDRRRETRQNLLLPPP